MTQGFQLPASLPRRALDDDEPGLRAWAATDQPAQGLVAARLAPA